MQHLYMSRVCQQGPPLAQVCDQHLAEEAGPSPRSSWSKAQVSSLCPDCKVSSELSPHEVSPHMATYLMSRIKRKLTVTADQAASGYHHCFFLEQVYGSKYFLNSPEACYLVLCPGRPSQAASHSDPPSHRLHNSRVPWPVHRDRDEDGRA